jgi:hypothetical protein
VSWNPFKIPKTELDPEDHKFYTKFQDADDNERLELMRSIGDLPTIRHSAFACWYICIRYLEEKVNG